MSPRKLSSTGGISLGAIALFAVVTLGALVLSASFLSPKSDSVAQPMRFSHKAHFEDATCETCHLYVMELASAGTPSLEDCVDCHDNTLSENAEDQLEEKKLEKYAEEDTEIPWIHLPRLTADIYFSHRMHAGLGEKPLECKNCHGDIGKSETLPQERQIAFTMSFCVDCHEKRQASNDCLMCHR
ncbi:MAG: cytochrome c3 family protein [Deltaproteobacteria bacterium]|nr:cytochrome c3 family protein [Deltaproteobacteria bacterium]